MMAKRETKIHLTGAGRENTTIISSTAGRNWSTITSFECVCDVNVSPTYWMRPVLFLLLLVLSGDSQQHIKKT
jgi:hypothetical protein